MSKKRYIYTIDDDCFVAKTPSGESINALEQHIRNLLTPSTPRFFNTLYDPFADGADFVRGYPFSWRQGAPTAVSHGELFHAGVMTVDLLMHKTAPAFRASCGNVRLSCCIAGCRAFTVCAWLSAPLLHCVLSLEVNCLLYLGGAPA